MMLAGKHYTTVVAIKHISCCYNDYFVYLFICKSIGS